MGRRKSRRGRKKSAAPVTGGQPVEGLDHAAPGAFATGGHRGEPDSDELSSQYRATSAYWRDRGLLGYSRTRQREMEEEHSCMLKTLRDQLKVLEDKLLENENIRHAIEWEIYQLECDTNNPLDEHFIIGFVKELVRENEFIEFQDYLKQRDDVIQHDSNILDIFKILVQKERVHKDYKVLNFDGIVNAINGRIVDLKIEQNSEGDRKGFLLRSALLKNDDGQSIDPIRDLLKAVRQKHYIMDEDPLKELNIIKIHNPVFYHNDFCRRMMVKYSENQVQVRSVPLDYDEEQVKAAFSVCGEVVDVKLGWGGPWSKIAYVTFQESEGAKIAPFLMDRASFSILPIDVPRKYELNSETRLELEWALKWYNDFRLSNTGGE